MSRNYHTPMTMAAARSATNLNSPLGELDAVLYNILNGTQDWPILAAHPSAPTSGIIAYIYNNDFYWQDSSGTIEHLIYTTQVIHAREEQVVTTDGGAFSNGAWRTRTLNTLVVDETGAASLGSNQLTVPAGYYFVAGRAPAFRVDGHQARLYDITNTAVLVLGTTGRAWDDAGVPAMSDSFIKGAITLTVETILEVQHQCVTTRAADGFGLATDEGTEVYTDLILRRISSE